MCEFEFVKYISFFFSEESVRTRSSSPVSNKGSDSTSTNDSRDKQDTSIRTGMSSHHLNI